MLHEGTCHISILHEAANQNKLHCFNAVSNWPVDVESFLLHIVIESIKSWLTHPNPALPSLLAYKCFNMNEILIYYVTCFVCKNTVYFYFLRCQLFAVILCILYILTSFFGSVNIGNQYMNKSILYCKNNFLSIICCIVRITFCLSFYIFIFISFFHV